MTTRIAGNARLAGMTRIACLECMAGIACTAWYYFAATGSNTPAKKKKSPCWPTSHGLASISGFIGVGISRTHFHHLAPKYVARCGLKTIGLSLTAKALSFVTGIYQNGT